MTSRADSKVIEHVTQKNSYANFFRSSSIMEEAAGPNITLPTLRSVFHNRKSLAEPDIYDMALISSLVAAIVTICTVSSISQIEPMMWLLIGAGLALGQVRSGNEIRTSAARPSTSNQQAGLQE